MPYRFIHYLTVFHIVLFAGVGIIVFTGSGEIGAQPNNGLVISNNPGSGRRFRFFCRSNSLTIGVGELIGSNGSPVITSSFFGFQTPTNGGELIVENFVGSEDPLTADGQGVYMCRMPLEGGGEGEINIGVYPSGFNSELIIYGPRVTHGVLRSRQYCLPFFFIELSTCTGFSTVKYLNSLPSTLARGK